MKLRVVAPRILWLIYLGTELLALPAFVCILLGIGPYAAMQALSSMRTGMLVCLTVVMLIPVLIEVFGFGSLRLTLDDRGVSYQTRSTEYRLNWNEVRRIALMPDATGQMTKSGYLCFFHDADLPQIQGRTGFSERAFGLQYRKGLPELIARYCALPMEHLDAIGVLPPAGRLSPAAGDAFPPPKPVEMSVISPRLAYSIYALIELLSLPMLGIYLYAGIQPSDSTFERVSWICLILFQLFLIASPLLIEKSDFGSSRFLMDETGVTYRTRKLNYHIDWQDVQHIMVIPDSLGRTTKNCFICFYADELLSWLPMRNNYTPTAFGVQYRKGLPEMIAQYCDKEIYNLDAIEKRPR